MSQEIWKATVSAVGTDAQDMFDAGVIILFGEPVPPALAEVALVHKDSQHATREIQVGDEVLIGEASYRVDNLGNIANKNLAELGHIVLYVNQPEQEVLPGAVLVTGPEVKAPEVGATISILGV